MRLRFINDQSASIAPIFAVAALPLMVATGAMVDFTNGFQQREVVQDALDAAALAASRINGIELVDKVKAEALAIFNANVDGKVGSQLALATQIEPGSVETLTRLTVDNYFLGLIGLKQQIYNLSSTAVTGSGRYEIALVLDNTGSMSGSKIASLRTAAADLVKVLFDSNANNPKTDPVKIGLVPFTLAVNVGPTYANADWIDTTAVGTYHSENFDASANRFDLFDQLRNVTWQGCVELRPSPEDVTDTAPTPADPDTMFVPLFAPDESDTGGSFSNDYISDGGGTCGRVRRLGAQERQELTCKYENASLSGNHRNGVRWGPNYGCTATPLSPLSTDRSAIEAKIRRMQASGMTNIHVGVMWGWRVLSPGAPFTEGSPYDEDDNTKIMIVMTDGANTYSSRRDFNRSTYGGYGYIGKGHLGTTSRRNSVVISKMNERTQRACTNVKAAGILVYTVAFKVTSSRTVQMLQDCATAPDMAFNSTSNSDLVATFNLIAKEISDLRLEK